MDLWIYERALQEKGTGNICGCDEAGAGPLAGPVYAAAVILPPGMEIPGLNDSKKLSAPRREKLFDFITHSAVSWAVAHVDADEIDRTDILSARMKAMQNAIDALNVQPVFALIDGNRDKGRSAAITAPHQTLVRGDSKSASTAASIVAKVSRDRYVCEVLDAQYPQYQFARHKGYGTKLHYELLEQYGPCPAHRKSFLKTWEARRNGTPLEPVREPVRKVLGNSGEQAVENFLLERQYEILARQWHCRYGELDLIARTPSGVICFVEVKSRSSDEFALPRESVNPRKQIRLRRSASKWLDEHDPGAFARFDVAEVYVHPGENFDVVYLEDAFQ